MLSFWGSVIPTLSSNYIMIRFMDELYERKYRKGIYIITYVAIVALQGLISLMKIPILSLSAFITIVIVVSKLAYQGEKKRLYTVIYIIYVIFLDMAIVPMYASVIQSTMAEVLDGDRPYFITGVASAIIGICTYKLVIRLIAKREVHVLTKGQEIFILFLGCFELLLTHAVLQIDSYNSVESNGITIFLILGFLIVDVYILFLFEYVSRQNELQKYSSLLEQQEQMNERYLEEVETQNDRYKKIMHDIRGHLQMLEKEKNVDKKYCDDIMKMLEHQGMQFRCSNPVLAAIVNDKLYLCEKKQIHLELKIEDVNLSFMRKIDITTIFLNLLNNAVEACEEIEIGDKEIKITIRELQGNIVVIITNTCCEKLRDYAVGKSTKKGHMGLGLANVREVLTKYGSKLYVEHKDKEFRVSFVIPIK